MGGGVAVGRVSSGLSDVLLVRFQVIVKRALKPISLSRGALEGKGPQRRLSRRLEEVAKRFGAVTVGYKCH